MLSLSHALKYCLAATAVGCFGMTMWSPEVRFQVSEATTQDSTSHRGSGRIVTQVPTQEDLELSNPLPQIQLERLEAGEIAHRGSGRVDPSPDTPPSTAYRGSGRVTPNSIESWQWA
ncbi:MAG: hypothetical protein ACFBSG_02950 [Leptolyngbyaceae cyanobacterium]